MTPGPSPRPTRLQIVRGEGRAALCVWEPGVVRTTREARALATTGCAHASSDPSPEMQAFLRLYADRFATHLGPATFTLGRVCIGGTGFGARPFLEELAELAGDLFNDPTRRVSIPPREPDARVSPARTAAHWMTR